MILTQSICSVITNAKLTDPLVLTLTADKQMLFLLLTEQTSLFLVTLLMLLL